ncbi:MAG TPA: hypothetical protein VM619_11080 [Luteimonas sp.]|nr:hypothetical protein [Luteimonas sp.]
MRVVHACLLALLPLATAVAGNGKKPSVPPDPSTDPVMTGAGFLDWHPDLRFRARGMVAYNDHDDAKALHDFQRAAYYADKASQAMVAEMLWNGRGAARDRPLAYAWMDLAAERGYPVFIAVRERYWRELDAGERTCAVEAGRAVYARYGDKVAKPRIAAQLRRGRGQVTGSRTGFVGNLSIIVPGPGGTMLRIDPEVYYAARYWEPRKYQKWQDAMWRDPRIGHVTVGDVEAVADPARSDATQP